MKITNVSEMDKRHIALDGCTVTFNGAVMDLMNPDPDIINLDDIAHGLAYNCRWNGATKKYYSIAEHCLRVATRCGEDRDRYLSGLFHDAEEAYWSDIISPLKALIRVQAPDILKKMEDMRLLIFDKYHLKYIDVSKEDSGELVWEFENLILTDQAPTMTIGMAQRSWRFEAKEFLNQ